jgi:hypothetical protein
MDVTTTAFHVVHDADGGVPAMAQFLGKARGTLDHELKPPRESFYKLGLVDALKITKRSGDHRILYAFAEECDHICLPAPRSLLDVDASTEKVLTRASRLSQAIAASFQELNAALADGKVSAGELARYEADAIDVIAAMTAVVRDMRAKMNRDVAQHHAAVEACRGEL